MLQREWDSSCPRVYDQWEASGAKWVIQDLPPEDHDAAMVIIKDHLLADETICNLTGCNTDPVSTRSLLEFWRKCLSLNTSLACYVEENGKKKLVALNVCFVTKEGEVPDVKIEGAPFEALFHVCHHLEHMEDAYKHLGVDSMLQAIGLVVMRDYRRQGLGTKILAAREPLCAVLGVKASGTIFTSEISQKAAARCGFETLSQITVKELAELGIALPRDNNTNIKYMCKKY